MHRSAWTMVALLAGIAVLAVTATAALGDEVSASTMHLGFTEQSPGTVTTMELRVEYRDPDDPEAKPSAVTRVEITPPAGTSFDLDGVPACTATDAELRVLGSLACPAGSEVGTGSLVAVTGLGPPVDPVEGEVTVHNTGDGMVEIVTLPGTDAPVLGTDRFRLEEGTLVASPSLPPGGPPDGRTSIRSVELVLPATTGYVTTPPTCNDGTWVGTATFEFADGTTQGARSTTPCAVAEAPGTSAPRSTARPDVDRGRAPAAHGTTASARAGDRALPSTGSGGPVSLMGTAVLAVALARVRRRATPNVSGPPRRSPGARGAGPAGRTPRR